jgi:hypothetical protein
MGLNSLGYRTDPGPQVVRASQIKSHVRADPEEVEEFISSGHLPPLFKVAWNEKEQFYNLCYAKDAPMFEALQYLGYTFLDVEVVNDDEDPLNDILVREEERSA